MTPPGVNPGEEGERDVVLLPVSPAPTSNSAAANLSRWPTWWWHTSSAPSRTVPSSRTRRRGTALAFTPAPAGRVRGPGGGHREHARGRAATHRRPLRRWVRNADQPLGRVQPGAALHEVQLLRAGGGGTPEGENILHRRKVSVRSAARSWEGEQRARRPIKRKILAAEA